MEKVTITRVFTSNKNKEGQPFTTKKGKPFWKVAIKTEEYGDEWLTALAFEPDHPTMQLKEGDTPLIVIEMSNGYKNFKLPTKQDLIESRLEQVEINQKKIIEHLGLNKAPNRGYDYPENTSPEPFPDDEIDPANIPF